MNAGNNNTCEVMSMECPMRCVFLLVHFLRGPDEVGGEREWMEEGNAMGNNTTEESDG